MAAFRFFNIGKANEEITRLESRIQELEAENTQLKDNGPAVEAEAEKVRGELADAQSKLAKADADLKAAQGDVTKLTAERDQAKKDLEAANAKLANPGEQVKKAASEQAAAIVQQIGVPPVPTTPNANPAATKPAEATGRARFLGAIKIN